MKKQIATLLFCTTLFMASAFSQEFSKYAQISAPPKTAFYNIKLSTEIKSSLKKDYSDIRLFDQENKEIQYLIYRKQEPDLSVLSLPTIQKVDSKTKKTSFYRITLPSPQYFGKVKLTISGADFFHRKAQFATTNNAEEISAQTSFTIFATFWVDSKTENIISFQEQKSKEFFLIIYDNDNASLQIDTAKLFQENLYLTAKLKKNTEYILRFENEDLTKPNYDLRFFKDSIPEKRDDILPEELNINAKVIAETNPPSEVYANENNTSPLIWAIIIIVILGLAFFSFKIMNDKNNSK